VKVQLFHLATTMLIGAMSACGSYTESQNFATLRVDGESGKGFLKIYSERSDCSREPVLGIEDMFDDQRDCDPRDYRAVSLSIGAMTFEKQDNESEMPFALEDWKDNSRIKFSSSEDVFFDFKARRPFLPTQQEVSIEWIDLGPSRGKIPRIRLAIPNSTVAGIQSLVGAKVDVYFVLQLISPGGQKDYREFGVNWKTGQGDLRHDFMPFDIPSASGFNAFQICYRARNFSKEDRARKSINIDVCSESFDLVWPN